MMKKTWNPIDTSKMIPIEKIESSGIDYSDELMELAGECFGFLQAKPWCSNVLCGWLAWGFGYFLGLFYVRVLPTTPDAPGHVWVVSGDLPMAAYDALKIPDLKTLINTYLEDLQAWADCALAGREPDETIMHVIVPADRDWGNEMQKKINLIKNELMPYIIAGIIPD